MKKLTSLVILLLLIIGVVFVGSPYYKAYQLKEAYDAKNGAAIADAIDYDQLQPNISRQLTDKMDNILDQYPMVTQLGGPALTQAADDFIVNSVKGAVQPDNIEQLITTQGQANTATKQLAAAWAIASNQVNLQNLIQDVITQRGNIDGVIQKQMQIMMDKQAEVLEQQAAQGNDTDKPTLSYCGINCFTISGQVKGYPLTIEMQRQGFVNWKIVNIVLP
ncbi:MULTISPECIES: DUF2939 domain-containing protein [unclassified Psychrobacter]|uniref:DUF2939 domain-containing protein n=1 Tax=unclassified Psychrobacter TaxID=196806 RepID=UPI0018F7BE4F|nr:MULTISPECIES: DUF2939 domain-containing protein [unclassified Psychrobacter]